MKYDDYAGIDAKGKIVLIFNHEPQEDDPDSIFNGKGNTRYANARAKMMIAQRHGAAAVLMMPDPNHKPGNQRGGLDAGPGAQTLRTPRPIQAIDGEDSIPVFNVTAKVGEELLAAAGQRGVNLQTSIDKTLKPASLVLGAAEVEVRAARRSENAASRST